jgi:hypothetical protein
MVEDVMWEPSPQRLHSYSRLGVAASCHENVKRLIVKGHRLGGMERDCLMCPAAGLR